MNHTVPLATSSGTGCSCGHDSHDEPVLDVRLIPHAIRHGSVFGAFDAVPKGGALVLVAPHNPLPLLTQLAERGPIGVEYLVEGPDEWRLRIRRFADDPELSSIS